MKKRKIFCLCLVLIVLAALLAGWMVQKESSGIFYRVSGGEKDLYLLGSIHVGSRDMYPMSGKIRKAMKEADVLVFECDTQSPEAAGVTQQMMRYAADDRLGNHISAETMQALEQAAKKTGYSTTAFEQLKPWAVTSMLSMETLSAEMGTRDVRRATELGVENQLRKQMGKKPVSYLETVESQLGLMDAFSPELQEYLLSTACEAILFPEEALDEELKLWPQWWAEGNAQAFADSYLKGLLEEAEPALAQEYHASLMKQRNKTMAKELDALLSSGRRVFATVGLMHLVLPDDSILYELEQMGYQVEKIEN